MQLKSFLIMFVALLSIVLIYMMVTHEIPIFSLIGGFSSEVVTFADSPFRFIIILIIVSAFCGYLIRTIRNL